MLFQHEQREQKVLKTEKGVCISRADRKWPNRHKMLATGYLDTDREKEGTTGNTSGFWRLAGKPFTKASVRHYALEDLKHRVSRDFQWSDRYLRKEFMTKRPSWKNKPSGNLDYCASLETIIHALERSIFLSSAVCLIAAALIVNSGLAHCIFLSTKLLKSVLNALLHFLEV